MSHGCFGNHQEGKQMDVPLAERRSQKTRFVRLNSRDCIACWKCIEKCPAKVIGRINLPWHKHAKLRNVEACTGCLGCVKICESGAIARNLPSAG